MFEFKEEVAISSPLSKMIVMNDVRAIVEVDIQRLETEFVIGYRDGNRVLYIIVYNSHEKYFELTDKTIGTWNLYWQLVNVKIELELQTDDDLASLRQKMFYVCDSNHRETVWTRHITDCHSDELK